MISSREEVTKLILAAKVSKGLKWSHVAEAIGLSKEWTLSLIHISEPTRPY